MGSGEGTKELLSIQPNEVKFPFQLRVQISCALRLVNSTDEHVAFRFKTTSPKKYLVRPNVGVVLPNSSCDVTVIMLALMETPPGMQCKDKFLVQSVIVPFGGASSARDVNSQQLLDKAFTIGKDLHKAKLAVKLYAPTPQGPPKSAEHPPGSVDQTEKRAEQSNKDLPGKDIREAKHRVLQMKLIETRAEPATITLELSRRLQEELAN
ncbi:unnamed protein product [Calypogeia fissa]